MGHNFTIRYKTEESKQKMLEILFELIKELSLQNYVIQEIEAFKNNRIIYNDSHTIIQNSYDYEKLKTNIEEFL